MPEGVGGFTFAPDSAIAGGPTTITRCGGSTSAENELDVQAQTPVQSGHPLRNPAPVQSSGRYEPNLGRAGGRSKFTATAAATPATSLTEGVAHGRALLKKAAGKHFKILVTPYITAFLNDEIDEIELARQKAAARKQVENEVSVRSESLDECEALLEPLAEDHAHASSLSKQIQELTEQFEEATLARDRATGKLVGKLQAALREAADW